MLTRFVALRVLCKAVSVFFLVAAVVAQGKMRAQNSESVQEQTFFTESEEFDHAVRLPDKVVQVLLRRREAKDALVYASESYRKNPSQLFEGTQVHLRNSDETDLVIRGLPPMSGADNVWYWIVTAKDGESPRVMLWCSTDSLELMEARTNGYKNIACSWSSPGGETIDLEYRFRGDKYALWKKTESSNRE